MTDQLSIQGLNMLMHVAKICERKSEGVLTIQSDVTSRHLFIRDGDIAFAQSNKNLNDLVSIL